MKIIYAQYYVVWTTIIIICVPFEQRLGIFNKLLWFMSLKYNNLSVDSKYE